MQRRGKYICLIVTDLAVLNDWVSDYTCRRQVHSCSDAACRILGRSEGSLLGHRIFVSSGGWVPGVQVLVPPSAPTAPTPKFTADI
jgi:hypothetical protein